MVKKGTNHQNNWKKVQRGLTVMPKVVLKQKTEKIVFGLESHKSPVFSEN